MGLFFNSEMKICLIELIFKTNSLKFKYQSSKYAVSVIAF